MKKLLICFLISLFSLSSYSLEHEYINVKKLNDGSSLKINPTSVKAHYTNNKIILFVDMIVNLKNPIVVEGSSSQKIYNIQITTATDCKSKTIVYVNSNFYDLNNNLIGTNNKQVLIKDYEIKSAPYYIVNLNCKYLYNYFNQYIDLSITKNT